MNDKTIFTFWEPKGMMVPYLQLCMRTWEKNLPDYEVVVLDHSNLGDYIPEGTLDLSALKRMRLPLQKDAILVAVLLEHGGIFMDVDTLALRDIAPVVARLKHTEMVMFSEHLAFVAARPGARILTLWIKGVQERLAQLADGRVAADGLRWDYAGNSVLTEVLEGMIGSLGFDRLTGIRIMDRCIQTCQGLLRGKGQRAERLAWRLRQASRTLIAKRRGLVFRTVYKKYLLMLRRNRYGYIPEAMRFKTKWMRPEDKYTKFWFESDMDVDQVFHPNQMLIGLHHSWTPEWYKRLSQQDVLEHPCLLSRTLRHILDA